MSGRVHIRFFISTEDSTRANTRANEEPINKIAVGFLRICKALMLPFRFAFVIGLQMKSDQA